MTRFGGICDQLPELVSIVTRYFIAEKQEQFLVPKVSDEEEAKPEQKSEDQNPEAGEGEAAAAADENNNNLPRL